MGEASLSSSEAAAVLGVDPNAEPFQIEAAFRRVILARHPDGGGNTEAAQAAIAARAALLQTSTESRARERGPVHPRPREFVKRHHWWWLPIFPFSTLRKR
jgi:hypothetical protein